MDSGRPVNEHSRLEESLSALMDDEAGELELRRILRELPANADLSATWKRYHAVRASLHQDIHTNPAINLLEGINARLAAEADSQPAPRRAFRLNAALVRHLGQGAIAASVAVAALMSVSLFDSDQSLPPTASVAQAPGAGTPVLNGNYTESELTRTVAADAEALERLEQAVYREFSGAPEAEAQEAPLNYVIELPEQAATAE